MSPGAVDESPSLLSGSPLLSAAQRLGIYQFAYQARLCECLENEFPVLRRTVGKDALRQLAVAYLRQFPSTNYTLGRLSEHFVGYLRDTRPPRSTTIGDVPDWADYIIDLATLEHTINQVFDGPGAEDQRLIGPDDLAQIAPTDWPRVRFECNASLRLLVLRFPAQTRFRVDRREPVPGSTWPQQTWLAVFRSGYAVRWHSLSIVEFEVLRSLASGETLGNAITAAAALHAFDEREILDAMRSIASKGLLLGLESVVIHNANERTAGTRGRS